MKDVQTYLVNDHRKSKVLGYVTRQLLNITSTSGLMYMYLRTINETMIPGLSLADRNFSHSFKVK